MVSRIMVVLLLVNVGCFLLLIVVVENNIESIFWIFNWVQRSTLRMGAQGGEIEKREERKICKLSAQIELYAFT